MLWVITSLLASGYELSQDSKLPRMRMPSQTRGHLPLNQPIPAACPPTPPPK